MLTRSVSTRVGRRPGMIFLNFTALLLTFGCARRGGSDPAKIYVLSSGRGTKITTYTLDGKPSTPTIHLGRCYCGGLAVDAAGRMYVANNWARDNVMVFAPDGTRVTRSLNLGIGALKVALDRAGKMYVLGNSRGNAVVKAFTPQGAATGLWVNTQISLASDIAVDASGKIYVAFNTSDVVKSYDASGHATTPTLHAGVDTPGAVAIGPDGKIYVGNHIAVTTYLPTGQRIAPTFAVSSPDGDRPTPSALAVDANGKIYVGYYSIGRGHGWVVIFGPNGKPVRPPIVTPEGVFGIAVR
jgi:hypothetical protein